ncbi:MAG: C25 family cysteine peptidase, partial [Candidatus Woesearchaeota archaeon]
MSRIFLELKVFSKFLLFILILFLFPLFSLTTFADNNIRNNSNYLGKEAFIISDKSWENIFMLIPVAIWNNQTNSTQNISNNIIVHPLLIIYEEREHPEYIDYSSPYQIKNITQNNSVYNNLIKVTSSGYADENSGPENFIDDSLESQWYSNATCIPSCWINIDLGQVYEIDFIRIFPGLGSKNYFMNISYSENGNNYNSIFSGIFNFQKTNGEINFSRRNMKKIKIEIYDPQTVSFSEIEVYNRDKFKLLDGFDADAVFYFLEMYKAGNITIIGETPYFFDELLTFEPNHGLGMKQEQIRRIKIINTDEEFTFTSFWEYYETIVYSEHDYIKSMLASIYASLHNAPLYISKESIPFYPSSIFDNKTVYLVGNVSCPQEARNCIYIPDIYELSRRYINETQTKQAILVNPNDLSHSVDLFQPRTYFRPQKTSKSIAYAYSRQSLSAPILAAAKNALIITVSLPPINTVVWGEPVCRSPQLQHSNIIRNKIKDTDLYFFNNTMEYLTIIGSPQSIIDSVPINRFFAKSFDNMYGFFPPYNVVNVGRIYGISPADVSAYIARSIFYEELKQNIYGVTFPEKNALLRAIAPDLNIFKYFYAFSNAQNLLRNNFFVDCFFDNNLFFPVCRNDAIPPNSVYRKKQIFNYWNHGSPTGLIGFNSKDIKLLELTWIFSNACSTSTFSIGRENTFAPRVLRGGGIVHFGSIGESYEWAFINTIFANNFLSLDEPLGVINKKLSTIDNNYLYSFVMLGDPTLRLNLSMSHHYACSDGVDNDGDGLIDFGQDPGCKMPYYHSEISHSCYDGIDNNNNSYIDFFDITCLVIGVETIIMPYQCNDCIDNDNDGLIDYPEDTECDSLYDANELQQCSDGIDNDNDGLIDYPIDTNCIDNLDNSEKPECSDGIDNDKDKKIDYYGRHGDFSIKDYSGCLSSSDDSEVDDNSCRDGVDNDGDGLIDYPNDDGCFNIFDPSELYECNDGIDNDGNMLIDYFSDVGRCWGPIDHSELYDCSDGLDNDNDGLIDMSDTFCNTASGWYENISIYQFQCNDTIDNDNDGFVDIEDVGCIFPFSFDDNESNPSFTKQYLFLIHNGENISINNTIDENIDVYLVNASQDLVKLVVTNTDLQQNATVILDHSNNSITLFNIMIKALFFIDNETLLFI